jgi:hypothetical protein
MSTSGIEAREIVRWTQIFLGLGDVAVANVIVKGERFSAKTEDSDVFACCLNAVNG